MKVIITGSTGMIGKGALLECIDDMRVETILIVNRNPIGIRHDKVKEVLLNDFTDPSPIKEAIVGYDAVFFCLGISAAGLSEEQYRKVTYDYTINFARLYKEVNPKGNFIYVSGTGTDSSEKGRMMWARVKGKTENDLLAMDFKKVYMFRPGTIRPLRGIKSRTALYRRLYVILSPFWPLLIGIFGKSITDTTRIGKAMVNVIANGSKEVYFENPEINQLADS